MKKICFTEALKCESYIPLIHLPNLSIYYNRQWEFKGILDVLTTSRSLE